MSIPCPRDSRVLSCLLTFLLVVSTTPIALAATPVAIPDGAPGTITSFYGAETDAHLGYDVAYDGDTVVVGIPDASSGGEVQIYRRTSAGLELQATIAGPDGGSFGYAVDVSGDTLLVGAPLVNSADGKAYFYRESGGIWSLETSVTGSAARVGRTGWDVSVESTTAVIGNPTFGGNRGAITFMSDLGAGWTQTGTWSSGIIDENAGEAVAAADGSVLAGGSGLNTSRGAIRLFTWNGSDWTLARTAFGSLAGDQLGYSVAVEGDIVAVGCPTADRDVSDSGFVRIYQMPSLTILADVEPDGTRVASERFGYSVSIDNGVLVVGAPGYTGGGRAVSFAGGGATWTQIGDLLPADPTTGFGGSVTNLAGDIIVGDPYNDFAFKDAGAAHEFSSDWFVGTEDTTLTVPAPGVLGNDYDADGDPLEAHLVDDVAHGDLKLETDGSFVYVPDPDHEGFDSFTYRTYDGSTYSTPTVASVYLTPVNDAPEFVQSSPTTVTCSEDEDPTPFSLTLDVNDPDVGDSIFWAISSQASHGTASVTGYGLSKSISYDPDPNYVGTDSFVVRINDSAKVYRYLTVDVVLDPINDPPTFDLTSSYSAPEDAGLKTVAGIASSILPGSRSYWTSVAGRPVLVTEVCADEVGQVLSANTINDNPSLFTIQPSISVTGTLTFQSAPNAYGSATVSLGITDDDTAGPPASITTTKTMTLTITPVNDAPVGGTDTYMIDEDDGLVVGQPGLLVNDTDVEGSSLTAHLEEDVTSGSLFMFENGSFIYSPPAGWSGIETFTYRAYDGALYSEPVTVTIDVGAVNDHPVIDQGGTVIASCAEDGSVDVTLTAGDLDGDTLTWTVVTRPHDGTASVVSADTTGVVTYTPDADFNGADAFTVQVADPYGGADLVVVQVDVTPVNDAPTAADDVYETAEDTTLTVETPGILGNDTDLEEDSLIVAFSTTPDHGSLVLSEFGGFTYVPEADYAGTVTFTYQAADAEASSAPATVTITVTPVNDAPFAAAESYVMESDTVLEVPAPGLLDNDLDIDDDPLTAVLDTAAENGTVTLEENGGFSYEPVAGWSGVDAFSYSAFDGDLASAPVTVTIEVQSFETEYTAVEGSDRFATAIEASRLAFPSSADTVVIATAYNWPDALTGSGLAGAVDGPILLTRPGELPAETLAEVQRLGATKAYVLGGEAVVSTAVMETLEAELGAGNVMRIGGSTRYETSAMVNAETIARLGAGWDHTALLATGADFPDAIAASPLSAAAGWPVFLVAPSGVTSETASTLAAMGVDDAIVLGGVATIPEGAEATLADAGIATERVAGSDRYSTSTAIAAYGVARAGLSWDMIGIATGEDFPDALAGGITCARKGGVLVLNPSDTLSDSLRSTLIAHRSQIDEVLFLGGTAALSDDVRDGVRNILR